MANISKINVAGSLYDLKDASARADLATLLGNGVAKALGTAAWVDTATTVVDGGTALPTQGAVYTAIQTAVESLEGAMHFMGVVERASEEQTDLEAIATFYAAKSITAKAGDVVVIKDNTKEYIYDGDAWQEFGDQSIYLTKAAAQNTYVAKTTTVAGIDLQDDITADEVKEALGLKALAYKDEAEGSVTTVDSADDITVAKADTYTVAGEAVAVPTAYKALDVTPAGSVTVSADVAAAATYQKTTSATIASTTVGEGQVANYTPAGDIDLPTFTSTVTPTKQDVATVTDEGTAYTITDGSVTKGTDSTDTFAKAGLVASMGEGDESETLILTAASTASAVTSSAEPVYVAPTISGALPTFGTKSVVTDATVATVKDGNATFSGTGVILGTTLGYTTDDATVTQPTYTANFDGTSKSVTPEASATANAAPISATVTVASETKSINLNKTTKTVTVS